jgi:hypothetical protein
MASSLHTTWSDQVSQKGMGESLSSRVDSNVDVIPSYSAPCSYIRHAGFVANANVLSVLDTDLISSPFAVACMYVS